MLGVGQYSASDKWSIAVAAPSIGLPVYPTAQLVTLPQLGWLGWRWTSMKAGEKSDRFCRENLVEEALSAQYNALNTTANATI